MQKKVKYLLLLLLAGFAANAQTPKSAVKNYIYIDKKGIIRYSSNQQKAYFFGDDPEVIATELNNEPKHSGPKPKVIEYVNRLAAATRNASWKKPIFYNISESFTYADAVANTLKQQYQDFEIPLNQLQPDSCLLLPRPYPSFFPLWFKAPAANVKLNQLDKLEVTASSNHENKPVSFEIESVLLKED